MISVGSVVRVYPGPPFILVNVVLVGVADAVDKIVWIMVLMDVCADGFCKGASQLETVPDYIAFANWGFSSAGRAPALQAGGQRFDPVKLHHIWS